MTTRNTNAKKLDPQFLERWSPRSFLPEPLSKESILSLFEASRWSPSCYNEQPWYFSFAQDKADRVRFGEALLEGNRWARKAPLLIALFARKTFEKNGKPNRWAGFDTGSAWMSLALQARKLGLYTHAMAGFDSEKAYEATGVDPEIYDCYCMIAVGKRGEQKELPEALQKIEAPNQRKPLDAIMHEGHERQERNN